MVFLFKALSFRISATFLLNVLVHKAVSQRQPMGPMSELTGTTATIDRILSPGNLGENPTSFTSTRTTPILSSRERAANLTSTCSVSFPGSTKNGASQSPNQRLNRRNLKSMKEDERSALFLTEAAEQCVESTRNWGKTEGYPLGVVICHSIGYLDTTESAVGRQINVFRLGTVAQLNELSETQVSELESGTRLQLSFSSEASPEGTIEYSRTSSEGALRLSQKAWAPLDDPSHLINPTNPHFTASYGNTEMVLIASFHLNLLDDYPVKSSKISKRSLSKRSAGLSPISAQLLGRDTENLKSHLINLTQQPVKRSRLVQSKPWGLFKRQNAAAAASSRGNFKPDSACSKSGSTEGIFSVGNDIQTPSIDAIIPPSPFLTAAVNNANPAFLPIVFPFNHEQNAILAASGRSNRIFTAMFQLPGRSLIVFPIGLIIYGILSLITLMMVMLVTFERIQYRKQFRTRKKNEVSLPPGESTGPFVMSSPV